MEITSAANPQFKSLLTLLSSKGIKKENQFFLMGEDLIQEFFQSEHRKKFKVTFQVRMKKMNPLTATTAPEIVFSSQLFQELDIVGTHFPLLVLEPLNEISAHKSKETNEAWPSPSNLVPVLPLGDPNNLGAAIRSCEAFGVTQIFLTEEACNPYLPKSIKSSAGAVLRVQFTKVGKLRDCIKQASSSFLALDQGGSNLMKTKLEKNLYLFVGEEGPGFKDLGLPNKNKISIPIQTTESLNATVAFSIALYEYRRQNS